MSRALFAQLFNGLRRTFSRFLRDLWKQTPLILSVFLGLPLLAVLAFLTWAGLVSLGFSAGGWVWIPGTPLALFLTLSLFVALNTLLDWAGEKANS